MANNKAFRVKNGLLAGRYLGSNGVETAGSVGYDLGAASYDSKSFSVASQETNLQGMTFNGNGTKMYILGVANDSVYQYSLSTAFDVSTASYDSVSFSVTSQDGVPTGLKFNSDGSKLFVVGQATDAVYQYSLSNSFDVSTASYDSVSFSFSSQTTSPNDIAFNTNGTKMYTIAWDGSTIRVFQYSLSTGFDLSTASYDSISFDVGNEEFDGRDLAFNSLGTKMYVVGSVADKIFQYTLSTPYNISTASYDSVSFNVKPQATSPQALSFKSDGTKVYICDDTTDTVYQYSTALPTQTLDLSTGNTFSFTPSGATTVSFTNAPASGAAIGFSVEINGDGSAITWPSSVKWPSGTAPTATASKELYAFVTTDGGTTYYGKKAAGDIA